MTFEQWLRYAAGLQPERRGWREWAAVFVGQKKPHEPEQALVALEVMLARMPGHWPPFLDSDWSFHVSVDVYTQCDGYYRPGRALALLERFWKWLHHNGQFSEEVLADVLATLDEQRTINGYKLRREFRGFQVADRAVPQEAAVFEALWPPEQRPFVRCAVLCIFGVLYRDERPGRLDVLDVEGFIARVSELWEDPEDVRLTAHFASQYYAYAAKLLVEGAPWEPRSGPPLLEGGTARLICDELRALGDGAVQGRSVAVH